MKLHKGDNVRVTVGKDAGKEAKIERVWREEEKVLLPGINMYKKHTKPKGEGQRGGIQDLARPLSIAKVALVCPKCSVVTRIGFKLINDKKVRICRKCEQEI